MAELVMQQDLCPTISQRSGFTLLEIMIALAIVSIAMISLLSLVNRSIGVHDRLQRITSATLLAQHKMAETEVNARNGSLAGAETEGVFDSPYDEYRWRITFAETPLPSIRLVTITVLWGDEERNEMVDITSFVF